MHGCACSRCGGTKKVIVGALLLLNGLLWPRWLGVDGWIQWFAVLMVLGGVVKLLWKNSCPDCAAACGMAMPKKGKK